MKNKKQNKKQLLLIIILVILFVFCLGFVCYNVYEQKQEELQRKKLVSEITSHYNKNVMTNKDADIYTYSDNNYVIAGKIGKNEVISLSEIDITFDTKYFKINSFEKEYYIKYNDVDVTEQKIENNDRYKKYILYNKNIVTKDKTSFYDDKGKLVYVLFESFDLPIIINNKDMYGIEYNNRLLYVKNTDVLEVKNSNNTDKKNTSGIAVLNYHFFYDESQASERADCNQSICHSKSGFTKHLDYIKNNNIFTPTMNEFEMYLNNEINLPKSVLITIDDGWRTEIGKELLEQYELNATIFLITSWFKEINWVHSSNYIEYHSHGDNLHNQGECPGGQGGAIKCKNKLFLLDDLALSRKKLDETTAFCYPFYEYNSYSISVLKEAGFTLAFAGGFKKATPKTDKYQIPRYVMFDYTTVSQLASYIN